jgi:hypothetical protein
VNKEMGSPTKQVTLWAGKRRQTVNCFSAYNEDRKISATDADVLLHKKCYIQSKYITRL